MSKIVPKEHVFIPLDQQEFFVSINKTIDLVQKKFKPIGNAFINNIQGLLDTITLPFNIILSTVVKRRFHQFHLAEVIRSKKVSLSSKVEKDAAEIANKKFQAELKSKEGINSLRDLTNSELRQLIENKDMKPAIDETLRQGVVLAWSAFEIFSKNLITQLINIYPHISIELVNNSKTNTKFQFKKIDLIKLAEYDFDISSSIGNIITENINFSNLSNIKNIFEVIYPNNKKINKKLSSPHIWELNQRRHCIVHNLGIIDDDFVTNTKSKAQVGTKLVVTPADLENQLFVIRDTATELLSATILLNA